MKTSHKAFKAWKALTDLTDRIRYPFRSDSFWVGLLDFIILPITLPLSIIPDLLRQVFRPFFTRTERAVILTPDLEGVLFTHTEDGQWVLPSINLEDDGVGCTQGISGSVQFLVEMWDGVAYTKFYFLNHGIFPSIKGFTLSRKDAENYIPAEVYQTFSDASPDWREHTFIAPEGWSLEYRCPCGGGPALIFTKGEDTILVNEKTGTIERRRGNALSWHPTFLEALRD